MFRAHLRLLNFSRLRYLANGRQFSCRTTTNLGNVILTRRAVARGVAGTVLTMSSIALATTVYADSEAEVKDITKPSLGSLVRAYAVYAMCSVPAIVDASPKILSVLSSVPGVRQITEAFVRMTFFNQFVGADTAEGAIPLLRSLRAANKGVLFAYSVEVDENEATGASFSPSTDNAPGSPDFPSIGNIDDSAAHKDIVNEMLHCIDVAADFELEELAKNKTNSGMGGGKTWVAVKMTALLPDAHALIALSSHIIDSRKNLPGSSNEAMVPFPGSARIEDLDVILQQTLSPSPFSSTPLTTIQINHLRELYTDLVRICARARERGVKVIVDAEYSWYQPAVDALTLALMREFNSLGSSKGAEVQPLVYGTFQAYLRRIPAQLALALDDARRNNYALGVKLVRGAYHPHELAAHEAGLAYEEARGTPHAIGTQRPSVSISPDVEPPVWKEKRDTDEAYNRCVSVLIKAVKEDVDRCSRLGGGKEAARGDGSANKEGWFAGLFGGANEAVPTTRYPGDTKTRPAPSIGVLFGTHNWTSCGLILEELVRNGLATVEDGAARVGSHGDKIIRVGDDIVERLAIGQLYGMSDDLTDWVVSQIISNTPFVIKYVPYGALADVMPYLSRRAIENKSVLGGAAIHERQRAGREIRKRLFG